MTNARTRSGIRTATLRKLTRVHLVLHLTSGKTFVVANSSLSFERQLKEAILGTSKLFTFGNEASRVTLPSTSIELIQRLPSFRTLVSSNYDFYVEDTDDVTAG